MTSYLVFSTVMLLKTKVDCRSPILLFLCRRSHVIFTRALHIENCISRLHFLVPMSKIASAWITSRAATDRPAVVDEMAEYRVGPFSLNSNASTSCRRHQLPVSLVSALPESANRETRRNSLQTHHTMEIFKFDPDLTLFSSFRDNVSQPLRALRIVAVQRSCRPNYDTFSWCVTVVSHLLQVPSFLKSMT